MIFFSFLLLLSICSCEQNDTPEEIISVNYNTKIQESLFKIPFNYQLSDAMKDSGFLSVEKKDEGLAVYQIKRKDYVQYISQLGASKKEIFDKCNTDYAPYVTSVSYNDDLTQITIAVNKADYENDSYENGSGYLKIQNCITGCINNVALYHSFSIGDFKECEIKVTDSVTGEVLETFYSPKALFNVNVGR